jgi:hypothetical protein
MAVWIVQDEPIEIGKRIEGLAVVAEKKRDFDITKLRMSTPHSDIIST